MESELLNRFTYNADNLRVAFRRNARAWRLGRYGICLLGLCASVGTSINLYRRYSHGFPNVILLLLNLCMYGIVGFMIWQTASALNRSVKRTIQRLEEIRHVTACEETIQFLEGEMLNAVSISSDAQHIFYTSVKRLVPYRNLILVYTKARLFIMLDRSRFENGTEVDFWKQMNEKCPKAVPKMFRVY